MAEVVFILGAGASSHARAPLMNEFLDAAEDELKSGELGGGKTQDFRLIFKALDALRMAQSKAYVNTQNLESVFAAFEMGILTGRLGALTEDEVQRLPAAMRGLMAETLERRIEYPVVDGQFQCHPAMEAFVRLLEEVREKRGAWPAIVTFNYDLCLDYGIYGARAPTDYCLGGKRSPDAVQLLKLHGSLNWARCLGCDSVRAHGLDDYLSRRHPWPHSKVLRLTTAAETVQRTHCDQCTDAGAELMIVPPTWGKSRHYARLGNVWAAAASALRDAVHIVVCGYSLPDSDYFFRDLYALGTIGPARLRQFVVVDVEPAVEQKFRRILGPDARERFTFLKGRFEDMPNLVRQRVLS